LGRSGITNAHLAQKRIAEQAIEGWFSSIDKSAHGACAIESAQLSEWPAEAQFRDKLGCGFAGSPSGTIDSIAAKRSTAANN
jgi:hypothetical protein